MKWNDFLVKLLDIALIAIIYAVLILTITLIFSFCAGILGGN